MCYITSLNGREITIIYTKSTLTMNFRKESVQERKLDEKFVQLLKIASGFLFHANSLIKAIPHIHFKRLLAILLLQNYLLMTFSSLDWQKCQNLLHLPFKNTSPEFKLRNQSKNSIHFFFQMKSIKIMRIVSAFNIFLNPRHVNKSTRRISVYGQPK